MNGGLGVLRATGDQTEGRYAVLELLAPKGFASPLLPMNSSSTNKR